MAGQHRGTAAESEWRRGRELNPRFTKGLFGDV